MRKIKWIGILALVLSITLSACTGISKTPETIDVMTSRFQRMVLSSGEKYNGIDSVVLSKQEIDKIVSLMKRNEWVPIFKPTTAYQIGFSLITTALHRYDFCLFNDKLLVVVKFTIHEYYFEGPKEVFDQIEPIIDKYTRARAALPQFKDSVFAGVSIQNSEIYDDWIKFDLTDNNDKVVLENALKREAWLIKEDENPYTGGSYPPTFQLTDAEGRRYNFIDYPDLPDEVRIFDQPTDDNTSSYYPIAVYLIPDDVVTAAQDVLKPLIIAEPVSDSVENAVFVKAYLDMKYNFLVSDIKSDYGYAFTPDQKTIFNAIDRSTWIEPSFPIYTQETCTFILYDAQDNLYCFNSYRFTNIGTMIKMIPKSNPDRPKYYLAPGLKAEELYLQLKNNYVQKGVPKSVTELGFSSIEEFDGLTFEYKIVATLTPTQSEQLIEALDYPFWKQTVGDKDGQMAYWYRLNTTSGKKFMIGFDMEAQQDKVGPDMAIVILPDGSERFFDLPLGFFDSFKLTVEKFK